VTEIHRLWHSVHETFSGVPNSNIVRPDVNAISNDTAKGAILYNEAYGVSVKKEIESRLSRGVSMGALHTALVRLEDKGYIKSFNGEQTEDRILLCLY
jgi:hypothetical protein